jgi:outer membrane murein-binding lipoprotein Lpp
MKTIIFLVVALAGLAGCQGDLEKDLSTTKHELNLCQGKLEATVHEWRKDVKDVYKDAQAQLDAQLKKYESFTFEQEEQLIQQANQIELLMFGLFERETAMSHKKYCELFGPVAIFCDKEKLEKAQALGEHTFDTATLAWLVFFTLLVLTSVPLLLFLAIGWYYWHLRIINYNQLCDEINETRANLIEREDYLVDYVNIAESKVKRARDELLQLEEAISKQKATLKDFDMQIANEKKQLEAVKQEVKAEEELKEAIKNIADF